MTAKRQNREFEKEGGFTLLEALLTVGVLSVLILGVFTISERWAEQIANRNEASYLSQVHEAAQDYVQANFANIWVNGFGEPSTDTTGDGVLDNADLIAIDKAVMITIGEEISGYAFFLKDETAAVSDDFPELTPTLRGVRIYVVNRGFINDLRTYEVFTLTYIPDPVPTGYRRVSGERVLDIVQAIGPDAGALVQDFGVTAEDESQQFASRFGAWSLDIADLSGANVVLGDVYDAAPPDGDAIGGYVGLRGIVTYRDALNGDYLYRIVIPGRPEVNRMEANLDMDENTLRNVNTMTVDRMVLNNGLTVNSTDMASDGSSVFVAEEIIDVRGTGSVEASAIDDANPACGFMIDGDGERVVNPAAGLCPVSGGNMIASAYPDGTASNVNTGALEAASAAGGAVSADTIEVDTAFDIRGSAFVQNNLTTVNTVTSGVAAETVHATASVTTNHLQLSELPAASGVTAATVGGLNVGSLRPSTSVTSGNMRVTGSLGAGTSTINSTLNANQFSMNNLTFCRSTVMHMFPYTAGSFTTVPEYDCIAGPD